MKVRMVVAGQTLLQELRSIPVLLCTATAVAVVTSLQCKTYKSLQVPFMPCRQFCNEGVCRYGPGRSLYTLSGLQAIRTV